MKTIKLFIAALFITSCFTLKAQVEYKPKQQSQGYEKKNEENIPKKKVHTEPPKDHIIKLNLLSPIVSTLMLFYQQNFSTENSFQIGIGYMNFDGFGNTSNTYNSPYSSSTSANNTNTKSFYFTPEYRYVFSGENMSGSFIAPFLRYSNMTYSADFTKTYYDPITYQSTSITNPFSFNYQTIGIGICIGQQYIYKNKVSIEVYAGPVYNMLVASTIPTGNPNYSKYDFGSNPIEIDKKISNINIKNYGIRAGFTVGFLF